MQSVELEPVFRGVISTAHGLVGAKPIKLLSEIEAGLPLAFGDETRIRQVLLNLYSNAAKFTDQGEIKLFARQVPEGIQVTVRDSGSGISQQDLGLIFEEFKQASNAGRDPRSGAGLGLAISRQLLELMGGHIWAESEIGKGSAFHFVVQRYGAQPEAQAMNQTTTA
jgi:signal transduction histidine kinase